MRGSDAEDQSRWGDGESRRMTVEPRQTGERTQAGVADDAASATSLSGNHGSLVRVKAGVAFMAFLCCWLFLRYVSGASAGVFAVAAISSVAMWFIRCERCHSSLYYRSGGRRFPSYGLTFLIQRRCPHCGLERL